MNVSVSYARAHLPELLKAVQRGKTITISRYDRPVADLAPPGKTRKMERKFGTLKGKIRILDSNWAAPMSAVEMDEFLEGR